MKQKSVNLEVVANKVYTLVTSRRFWVALFTIFLMVVRGPEASDYADQLGDQAVGWVEMLVQVVGPIITLTGLGVSFHLRPPTKTDYKSAETLEDTLKNLVD